MASQTPDPGAAAGAPAAPGTPAAPATPPLLASVALAPGVEPIERLGETRALFWQNVVREMLLTFPLVANNRPEVADGRIGVLTRHGERIPLADATPLFPCSIASPESKALCLAVQATVFNLRTPAGEVFTVPIEEIRGLHTMTDDLVRAMEDEARKVRGPESEDESEPFGFAAYTSLAKQRRDAANQQRQNAVGKKP